MRLLATILTTLFFLVNPTLESYTRSPHVSQHTWDMLKPYFLPEDHPVKAQLDTVFSNARVLTDEDTLVDAGFKRPKPLANKNRPHVLRHPQFPEYLIKAYLHTSEIDEVQKWILRLQGAYGIRNGIKSRGYEKFFSVPQKWLYPIPGDPLPSGTKRKNFVLVVQNMHILKKDENKQAWKSAAVTRELLDALFTLVEEEGLADSLFVFNIPFSRIDGRISFIDTEDYRMWPINYVRIEKYLSKDMKKYWHKLIKEKGGHSHF